MTAGGSIDASAGRDVTGRDRINNYYYSPQFNQRSVAEAHIQKLESLKNRIDCDVSILVRVRQTFDKLSDLESRISKGVGKEPRMQISAFQLQTRLVLDELEKLDYDLRNTGYGTDEMGRALSDAHDGLVALERKNEELGSQAKPSKQELDKLGWEFERLVAELDKETPRLRRGIGMLGDRFYKDAESQITILHDVINDLRRDLTQGQRLDTSESTSSRDYSTTGSEEYRKPGFAGQEAGLLRAVEREQKYG